MIAQKTETEREPDRLESLPLMQVLAIAEASERPAWHYNEEN